jgi:murein DD-endopeptidase MepM/ murein hydrolase activator NlpD
MKQAFTPRFSRFGQILLLVALSFGSAPTIVWQQQTLKALAGEAKAVGTSKKWLQGSFPVEHFQGYTSPFGYRHSATGGAGWEFHPGLDIAAPEGSYIRNWWVGTVAQVSDGTSCGTYIVIQSGEWQHIYCHMKGHVESSSGGRYLIDREGGIQIWEGEQVPAGARIGRVGMTGRTTGPHLHWGLKYAGKYIDPAMVLQAMYAQESATTKHAAVSNQHTSVTIESSQTSGDSGY